MSTKPKHTIEQSRKIIQNSFNLLKDLFTNVSIDQIVKNTTPESDSKVFLKNLISQLDNPDLKFNNLMKEAGNLLKNNDKLVKLIKKGDINFDNLLKEGVKLLEENETINKMVDEIANNDKVVEEYKKSKTEAPPSQFQVLDEEELMKFIEKTQVTHPDFKMEDMSSNIYEFFNQYPTKENLRFPDGTIINMKVNEPAVDIDHNILPLKEGIPQGEEAGRIITKNMDTGVVIASPPGVYRAYFITRYGTPKSYGCELEKYKELQNVVGIDFSENCFFEKFNCEGKVKPIICLDLDTELNCCQKHHSISSYMLNINIALISDISQFYDNAVFKYLTHKNQPKKIQLLKKMQILINLAEKGRLKNRQLDADFKLYGIHYYYQYSYALNKPTYGWALIYYSITGDKKKMCHIYLDEITDDEKVNSVIAILAKEVILSKYRNDLEAIHNFINNKNKTNYDTINKVIKKDYIIDMLDIMNNKLIIK